MVQAPYTLEQAELDIGDLRGGLDRLGEILSLLDGPIPNNPPSSGCQIFSANGQPNFLNFSSLQMSLQGAQPAIFPGTTVTAASLTDIAAFTIPAGDADVGAVYEVDVWGNGIQGTLGNRQTLQCGAAIGGTALQSVTFGTTAFENVGNQAFRFRIQARMICVTTGSLGTWTSYVKATVSDFGSNIAPGNNDFAEGFACESTGTTTKDTTVAQTASAQIAWGATTGAPSLTSRVAVFKRIC
jgi:hypothetical protein